MSGKCLHDAHGFVLRAFHVRTDDNQKTRSESANVDKLWNNCLELSWALHTSILYIYYTLFNFWDLPACSLAMPTSFVHDFDRNLRCSLLLVLGRQLLDLGSNTALLSVTLSSLLTSMQQVTILLRD